MYRAVELENYSNAQALLILDDELSTIISK